MPLSPFQAGLLHIAALDVTEETLFLDLTLKTLGPGFIGQLSLRPPHLDLPPTNDSI